MGRDPGPAPPVDQLKVAIQLEGCARKEGALLFVDTDDCLYAFHSQRLSPYVRQQCLVYHEALTYLLRIRAA
jgi:hypothetical protein